MSRIGKKPVPVPSGVKVEVKGQEVSVSGPKGSLSWSCPEGITPAYDAEGQQVVVSRPNDESRSKALHGLSRALINNMVFGVSQGYEKKIEIYGTGYSCNLKGQNLLLNCGHMGRGVDRKGKPTQAQFVIDVPKGLTITVEAATARGDTEPARMTITGPDKQQVGQFAAEIRRLQPPEPYKGKGIRYADEHVRRKQGKAFAGGG
jgi:large subunit ribosomal protein L6